jgi:hypothetical protein
VARLVARRDEIADRLAALERESAELRGRVARHNESRRAAGSVAAALIDDVEDKRARLARLQSAVAVFSQIDAARKINGAGDTSRGENLPVLAERTSELESQISATIEPLLERRRGFDEQEKVLQQLHSALAALDEPSESLRRAAAESELELSQAEAKLSEAASARETAYRTLTESWVRRFVVKPLQPLSPEQLANSTIRALRLDARFQREAQAEWETKHKDQEPADVAATKKAEEVRALYDNRVRQVDATFVSLFAAPPAAPQDVFSSTVDQALFLANDGRLRNWLQPSEGALLKCLQDASSSSELTEELYLSVLNRLPTTAESAEATAYLAARQDERAAAIQDLVWGLLTSVEFRFNH